jgi:AraC family transcriptional regulator, transcriptional activator of pobA
MAKPVPVLQLNQFQVPATLHPHFYVQRLNEHLAHFEFIQKAHRHDFYCLFLFTRGTGRHIIDFESYLVAPGSMFFMSPAQMHSWQLSDDTDGYVIFFNAEFYFLNHTYKSLTDFPFFHYTSTPAVLLSGSGKEAIGDLFARIYQEFRGQNQGKTKYYVLTCISY